ncbi:MAG: hypothetical protein JJ975_08535 [Bacteroidia bacterium]|nr:hypothetical protein [Bacteroidia bacterium]
MRLKLVQHIDRNKQACGILLRGSSVKEWLIELSRLKLNLNTCKLYGLPDETPNSIWGCLVLTSQRIDPQIDHLHERCYQRTKQLILPLNSREYPILSDNELEHMFGSGLHLYHPGIGLFELEEEIDVSELLELPPNEIQTTITPRDGYLPSSEIHSFFVVPQDEKDVLENLEKNLFPKQQKSEKGKLNLWERVKLQFYRLFFKSNGEKKPSELVVEKRRGLKWLQKGLAPFFKGTERTVDTLFEDYEDLEQRNISELNKLLDMLESDPENALKYAMPLDTRGSGRGGGSGWAAYKFGKIWERLSLFGDGIGYDSEGGAITLDDDTFAQLQQRYQLTAEALIKEGKYEKAAFVYLKLLKSEYQAAQTLEKGKLYKEAAALYVKFGTKESKELAAECYEKGSMYSKAATLYKETGKYEKAGDMRVLLNQRAEAMQLFELRRQELVDGNQYVKAAKLSKSKMSEFDKGQELLLEGWRNKHDAFNCLTYYFAEFKDEKELKSQVGFVYKKEIQGHGQSMQADFVHLLKTLYAKDGDREEFKDLAYKIVAENAPEDRSFAALLKGFNPTDKELAKDTMRYRSKRAKQ